MLRTAARPLALLFTGLLVVGLAACGDDDDPVASDDAPTTTAAPSDSSGYGSGGTDGADAATDEVTIVAKDFSLTSVTAQPGEAVHLSNTGAKPHTVTADDGEFDTGTVAAGREAEFVAPSEPGTYTFHCSIHAAMTGELTVEA